MNEYGVAVQPPAAGWWLASDGRWYPPQTAPAPAVVVNVGLATVAMTPGRAPGAGWAT